MASGSFAKGYSETESHEPLPHISPDKGKGQKRMRGTTKASKASQKKPKEIEEEVNQWEEQAMVSEDRPKRGGRRLEQNTTNEN